MHYSRRDAKSHARANMTGIWAAALTPFTARLAIDEDGLRQNIDHWVGALGVDGIFVGGKQGECFAMSLSERKRLFELAVQACRGRAQTILSCSDQNLDVVIELARHAERIGGDYIVVHAPVLHFATAQDETLVNYYRTIASKVDIGTALWSHPDSGYLMRPALCNRLADIETVVAIKYSVPRPTYSELTRLAGDRLLVSTASEAEWLDNIVELGWRLYLCSSPPFLIQSAADRRMKQYTELAFAGDAGKAREVRDSLDPVRAALAATRPAEKPHAHQKYWQTLLGQVGGGVRPPLLDLTEAEKRASRKAFEGCGLAHRNA
jgi:4-hydroxy-tetrahydrodipicolinate synthase